jgi:hypothetical protein
MHLFIASTTPPPPPTKKKKKKQIAFGKRRKTLSQSDGVKD